MDTFLEEQRPNFSYFPLVDKSDQGVITEDPEYTHVDFPDRKISNIGLVSVALSQVNIENPDNEFPDNKTYSDLVYEISDEGVTTVSQEDALRRGLFQFGIAIDNPVRQRGLSSNAILSLEGNGDDFTCHMYNHSEIEEEHQRFYGKDYIAEGTQIGSDGRWTQQSSGEARSIYVENNPDMLAKLRFRFEFVQQRGGEMTTQ